MKKMKNIYKLLIFFSLFSCNENDILNEVPLDFYSPENSYVTAENFQSALNNLYYRTVYMYWGMNDDNKYASFYATDFAYNGTNYSPTTLGKLNDYTNVMVPTFAAPSGWWNELYGMINDANTILNRIELDVSTVSEETKKTIKGEAHFFRAFAYRILANLFGGVPISLDEITSPKTDFVRVTRKEVYEQCAEDLKFAIENLKTVSEVKDGKISSTAANHLLAEIYICLEEWDKAIEAATNVINDPNMALMNNRFGSAKNLPGDVYWDLFRNNNQNRSTSGNKEGIWVLQYDYLNAGSSISFNSPRFFIPFYQTITIKETVNGTTKSVSPFLGVTDKKGGRGIGWVRPTTYFYHQLWGNDFENDIRNSKYNIVRDARIDNPNSANFGKWFVKDGFVAQVDTGRSWYPIITKVARVEGFPEDLYVNPNNPSDTTAFGERLMLNAANSSYKDEYMFRLAETYLLRAEAYLGKNNKTAAAADINIIRTRANATPVNASDVNIDYILDERMRELYTEERRMFTLTRIGKLVERSRLYNPYTGKTISDYHNLWPIPYSEIERNTNATLEQNPGYAN